MSNHQLTPTEAYRRMAFIRRFEEEVLELGRDGHIAGSIHPCHGQEAIPVGAMAALTAQDRVLSTYRGHGWALACGVDPTALMAEIAQRGAGVNGGRAGSPLLSDPAQGFLGENSIVGAGVPIAAGVALAGTLQGTKRVVLTSIGDGAMNQGSVTEGMVFAAARKLPLIILCENNGWSEMTPISATTRGEHLARRGQGLGIHSQVVDGGDPVAVAEAVSAAAEVCRAGEGPVLIECKTVRLSGHYNKDIQHYRPQDDIERAQAGDPLARLVAMADGLSAEEVAAISADVDAEVSRIGQAVREMDPPKTHDVLDHLYAPAVKVPAAATKVVEKELPFNRAVNEALKDAMRRRQDVVVYGEDVGVAGGVFGVTRGLQKEFGVERVFDTPIAEAAILGSAVGAALEGLRPVVEIMWADFVFVALDQIVNQAANIRYINRSQLAAPLVIRMQQGVTPGSCAQHSQSIEAILAHIPGIKVGLPSTPQDAYAMSLAAIEDPDPVVLIEHRSMYQDTGTVRLAGVTERAEGARLRRDGSDVAIITWGSMVAPALEAARQLTESGIEASVLDLRWLRPLDDRAIAEVVAHCGGKVVVAHEAILTGGFGAEVAARITERHFSTLTAPVARVGTPDVRIPSAPALQRAIVPGVDDLVDAIRKQIAH
ncbi:alpha-ketoacid dehydrogenase subunit alpha/beta [Acrocarpospora catenulata]|uniref:alpha-ketoacid dehydrogenase subunit alpha/beta n=1 Tax=Acrocarpospora catenulata TaxID=2836182 RepID=UPI001BD984FC|nr:alpha-ketoacid dehydrogenase subunit alpha/beta [Acrocarpospora catenulata]